MAKDQMKREPEWTEAIAVGGEQFIERIEPLIRNRREIRAGCLENVSWILQDARSPINLTRRAGRVSDAGSDLSNVQDLNQLHRFEDRKRALGSIFAREPSF